MRILITLGPTQEPIDAVRYIGNRSSGQMGVALAAAACDAGHTVTTVCGPIALKVDPRAKCVEVVTAQEMFDAVTHEFPNHDLLIMAAAVADFTPIRTAPMKLERSNSLVIELKPTTDIVAAVSKSRRPDQRTVAFSLESDGNIERAQRKMRYKSVDLMVFNPLSTMNAPGISPTLLRPDGSVRSVPLMPKTQFASELLAEAIRLFS
jgi:phosphopantothenoylcysteine decarboxylase / phosphopantothenate---cysteine ligase